MKSINPEHVLSLMRRLEAAPFFSLLGMRFQAMEPGYCRLEVLFDHARHGNAFGGAHGGVYASLIDTVAYWALYCQMEEEQGYTSLDLSVTNLAAIRSGRLIAEGRVIRAGRSICISEGTVKNGDGRLLAHGISKLMLLEGRQSIRALLDVVEGPPLPPKFLS